MPAMLAVCKLFCYIYTRVSLFGAVLECVIKASCQKEGYKVSTAEPKSSEINLN
jgi:hypothetical protein